MIMLLHKKCMFFTFQSIFDFLKMDKKNVQNRLAENTFGKKYQIIDITEKSGQRIYRLFWHEIWFYTRINDANPGFSVLLIALSI